MHSTTAAGLAWATSSVHAAPSTAPHIATNTYPWGTFAKRDGKTVDLHSDESLAAIASTGLTGYEPIITRPAEFDGLAARLKTHGLEMRSLYVNSNLHEDTVAEASVAEVLAIARRAVDVGTRIIVTNPSPIRWGGPENKRGVAQAETGVTTGTTGSRLPLTSPPVERGDSTHRDTPWSVRRSDGTTRNTTPLVPGSGPEIPRNVPRI